MVSNVQREPIVYGGLQWRELCRGQHGRLCRLEGTNYTCVLPLDNKASEVYIPTVQSLTV